VTGSHPKTLFWMPVCAGMTRDVLGVFVIPAKAGIQPSALKEVFGQLLDFPFAHELADILSLPDSQGDNRQGRVWRPSRGKLASV
jgi:hypothetical protein